MLKENRYTRILTIQVVYNLLYNERFLIDMDYTNTIENITQNSCGTCYLEDDEGDNSQQNVDLELLEKLLSIFKTEHIVFKEDLTKHLINWTIERIDILKLAIIYVSACESVLDKSQQTKRIVNEYIKVSKSFFPVRQDTAFFNAIIEKTLTSLKEREA